MSNVVISVVKHGTENTAALIRRFQKRVQGAGIIRKKKAARYHSRPASRTTKKHSALARIEKRAKLEELIKLGKAPEPTRRGGMRPRESSSTNAATQSSSGGAVAPATESAAS
jgi:ribosomal protein S21